MQARLSAMLPVNTRAMWIGTFTACATGCCGRTTRRRAAGAVPDPRFRRPAVGGEADAEEPQCRRREISAARAVPFHQCAQGQGIRAAQAEIFDDYTRRRVELYAEYEAQCQREGVVDFAELLLRTYELLTRNEPLRLHYQQRFRHILVDEFQDTNVLQYKPG